MATITWNPTIGGDWSNTLDWIGGVVPGTADTAFISAPSDEPAGPSIAAGTSITVGSVVMQGGGAELLLEGTLAPVEGVTLDGGQLEFLGGELSGLVDFAGGAFTVVEEGAPPGTLDAVTFAGSTDIAGTFEVTGGMTVQSPTANLAGATFDFLGTQTLTGNLIDGMSLSNEGSLTIAAGTTLSDAGGTAVQQGTSFGSGGIVNDGVILGASVSLGLDFVNNGAITLSGAPSGSNVTFDSVATFDNVGTLLLTGGATLSPLLNSNSSSFTNGGLIEIAAGSTLAPTYGGAATNPVLDNSGGTISLDAGGVLEPLMKISGGTIRSDGGTISSAYGPVEDALIAGSVVVLGELGGDGLTFAPTADATTATITLAPHDAGDDGEIDDRGNLTLSAGTALTFDATSDIDTTPQTGFSMYGASLNLGGAIAALAGGTLTLQAESTNSLDQAAYGLFSNSGSIATAAGETLILSAGTLVNTGTIALDAGATLEFTPYTTLAFINSIQNDGGAIVIDGTLDATGETETLGAGSVFSNLTFGANAVLLGGTFVTDGSTLPPVATLDATTWHGTLDLSSVGSISVVGGITFAGSAGGAGTVLLPVDGVLNVGSDTTLGNADLMFGEPASGGATTEMGQLIGDDGPLSIGTQATLQIDAPVAGYFAVGATTLTNQGVISFGTENVGLVFSGGAIDSATFSFLIAAFGPGLQSVLTGASVSPAPTLTASDLTGIGQDTAAVTGSGTLVVQAGGIAILDASVASAQAIEFGGAGGGLILTDPTGIGDEISQFGSADVIDLPLEHFSGGTATDADGIVTIPSASGATELHVELAAGISASQLKLRADPVGGTALYVACFVEGTRVATPRGRVAVERLRAGDAVLTASGAERAVVWTGHRRLAPRRHPRPHDVQPVRIEAGAFAPGAPGRDLRLSPDHAVFVEGALIPVRYLLNGASVMQEDVASITYWHVELARHDVLLAEGVPCESFLDTGNRGAFAGEAPARALHPTFARDVWARNACAPLVLSGPALTQARARLIARLPALGHRITDDPALLLFADGAACSARHAGDWVRLLLPAGRRTLRLRSRVGVPAHLDAASDDARCLGVALTDLRLDGAPLPLGDPRLAAGWHAAEPGLRWTDGDARIDLAGARLIELRLASGLLRYCARALPGTRGATSRG